VTAPAVEARALDVRYGARRVLEDVSLTLEPGAMAAICGPNGAGKSTLLRCLSGAMAPAGGSVLIDDVPLREYDRGRLARRIAVVPGQMPAAFPIRVEELVALGRLPHEHPLLGPRAADRAAVDAAIERVGVGRLRGRDVRELSLGERQLVVVAMAVAQGSRLLLLDEPTVHLDLRHQVEIMELLRDLAQRDGVTIVAVLHDLGLVRHFFDRLVLLHGGRVVADGQPAVVLTREIVGAVYGVDPRLVPGLPFIDREIAGS
jgi:iron complex transport system ATP-binding protein